MLASPALIAAYLSHLAEDRHLSVATVRLHRAALAAIHKSNGHQDPTDNEAASVKETGELIRQLEEESCTIRGQ